MKTNNIIFLIGLILLSGCIQQGNSSIPIISLPTNVVIFANGSTLNYSGNINVQGLLTSSSIKDTGLLSQNCIGTDENGTLIAGSCGAGGGTTFNLLNLTNYFGDSSFNSSVIRNSNLTLYNKSVSLDNYLTASANGAFLKNLSPDVIFTTLNVSSINGTSIASYNKSVSLDNYLNGLPAGLWNLLNLTNYFGDSSINSSILRVNNISNIQNGAYNSVNFTSNYASRLAEEFNLLNLTNYFGDSSFNSSVLRVGNISNIRIGNYNLANFSSNLASTNISIFNSTGNGNFIASDFSRDTFAMQKVNVTNLTISNWTQGAIVVSSYPIINNGSGICIYKC